MKKIFIVIIIASLIVVGCSRDVENIKNNEIIENKTNIEKVVEEEIQVIESIEEKIEVVEEESEDVQEIDLDKIRPNEIGKVMVVMYHSFGEEEKQFVSTPDIFREDLIVFNELGYVLVSLDDYVNNNMNIPAGKTPVVFTFDDGHSSNFRILDEDAKIKIDPDSAVGIMDDFYSENNDFGREATFFLNGNVMFGQLEYIDYKLNYLIDNGYDIGNHSYGHEDLSKLTKEGIQKTLGRNKEQIESYLDNYNVNTLALPFGKRPKDAELSKFVVNGRYNDKEYNNIGVLNVGWNPANSPISINFNSNSINRVQAGSMDYQLDHWIDYFEKNPDRKYISDGDINTITIPSVLKESLNMEKLDNKELILYERK